MAQSSPAPPLIHHTVAMHLTAKLKLHFCSALHYFTVYQCTPLLHCNSALHYFTALYQCTLLLHCSALCSYMVKVLSAAAPVLDNHQIASCTILRSPYAAFHPSTAPFQGKT